MLNRQQTAAVKYIDGPLLVLAGAGSGKTRVITHKIAYLIEECSYSAKNIYAVTFTNKAANEMRTRAASALSAAKRHGLKIMTFHTLGLSIIKRHLTDCNLRSGFTIFDNHDCQQLLRNFLSAAKANDRQYLLTLQQQISRWKNDLLNYDEISCQSETDEEMINVYRQYQQALQTYNAVDFDDLIYMPVKLLQQHSTIREIWQNKIRHLLIDEYQDSNTSQYLLVKLLTGIRASFTIVGDDHQSIYAWRNARPENLAQLQHDYLQLKIIKLEQNYRSSGLILHAANTLIANNQLVFTKKLWSELGHGEPLRVLVCKDEQHEAEQIIADLISRKLRFGKNYGDYAILYRSNHQARVFEKILRHHGIAYNLSGGQSWFARAEIKDIFAYLKLLNNEMDDAAFLRAVNNPKRGIGDTSLNALAQYAQTRSQSLLQCADHLALANRLADKPRAALQGFKRWLNTVKERLLHQSPLDTLKAMVNESGYENYLYEQCNSPAKAQKCMDNVWELLAWIDRLMAKNPANTLSDIINKLILIDILEQDDQLHVEQVQLMTLHAAKGLEFPDVYLAGMEEDLLPHRASIETDQIEEERRLAYVGITRAQKSLCFTFAKKRRRQGELIDCLPSRFLEELPADCLEWFGKGERDETRSKALAQSHLTSLKNLLA